MRRSLAGLALLGGTLGGCLGDPPPPTDPELRAELGIPDEVPIHRIDLSGRADETRVLPLRTDAESGDVVQFVVLDRRVHRVRFLVEAMDPEGREFLERTGQVGFPPLVERGARIVLSFEGAPEGPYPYEVTGYGDPVRGEIRIGGP